MCIRDRSYFVRIFMTSCSFVSANYLENYWVICDAPLSKLPVSLLTNQRLSALISAGRIRGDAKDVSMPNVTEVVWGMGVTVGAICNLYVNYQRTITGVSSYSFSAGMMINPIMRRLSSQSDGTRSPKPLMTSFLMKIS